MTHDFNSAGLPTHTRKAHPPRRPKTIDGVWHWHCTLCLQWLPRAAFAGQREDYAPSHCKACKRQRWRERHGPKQAMAILNEDTEFFELVEQLRALPAKLKDSLKQAIREYLERSRHG